MCVCVLFYGYRILSIDIFDNKIVIDHGTVDFISFRHIFCAEWSNDIKCYWPIQYVLNP